LFLIIVVAYFGKRSKVCGVVAAQFAVNCHGGAVHLVLILLLAAVFVLGGGGQVNEHVLGQAILLRLLDYEHLCWRNTAITFGGRNVSGSSKFLRFRMRFS